MIESRWTRDKIKAYLMALGPNDRGAQEIIDFLEEEGRQRGVQQTVEKYKEGTLAWGMFLATYDALHNKCSLSEEQ